MILIILKNMWNKKSNGHLNGPLISINEGRLQDNLNTFASLHTPPHPLPEFEFTKEAKSMDFPKNSKRGTKS